MSKELGQNTPPPMSEGELGALFYRRIAPADLFPVPADLFTLSGTVEDDSLIAGRIIDRSTLAISGLTVHLHGHQLYLFNALAYQRKTPGGVGAEELMRFGYHPGVSSNVRHRSFTNNIDGLSSKLSLPDQQLIVAKGSLRQRRYHLVRVLHIEDERTGDQTAAERQESLYQHVSTRITQHAHRPETMPETSEPARPVHITNDSTLAVGEHAPTLNEHELTLLNLFRLTGESALTARELTALGFHLYAESDEDRLFVLHKTIRSLGKKLAFEGDRHAALVKQSGHGVAVARWTHNYRFIDARKAGPEASETFGTLCQDMLREVRTHVQSLEVIQDTPAPTTVVPAEYLTLAEFAKLANIRTARVKTYLQEHPEIPVHEYDEAARRNKFLDGATMYALRRLLQPHEVATQDSLSTAELAASLGVASTSTVVRYLMGTEWENLPLTLPPSGKGTPRLHYPPAAVAYLETTLLPIELPEGITTPFKEILETTSLPPATALRRLSSFGYTAVRVRSDGGHPTTYYPPEALQDVAAEPIIGPPAEGWIDLQEIAQQLDLSFAETRMLATKAAIPVEPRKIKKKAMRKLYGPLQSFLTAVANNTHVSSNSVAETPPLAPPERPSRQNGQQREDPFVLETPGSGTEPIKSPASGAGSPMFLNTSRRQAEEATAGLPPEHKKSASHLPETPGSWTPAVTDVKPTMMIGQYERLTARQIAQNYGITVDTVVAAVGRIDPGDRQPENNETGEPVYTGSIIMAIREQLTGIRLEQVQQDLGIDEKQLPRLFQYLSRNGFRVFNNRLSPGAVTFLTNHLAAAMQPLTADE